MRPSPGSPSFQLILPNFEGSFQHLVQLIDQRKLQPADVQVAEITAQCGQYVSHQNAMDLEVTGDYLRTISRLMLLKSESLLPRPQLEEKVEPEIVPDPVAQEEKERLRQASQMLLQRQGEEAFPGAPRFHLVERQVQPRPAALLRRAWEEMCRQGPEEVVKVTAPAFVRLEVALSRIIRGLRRGKNLCLQHILRGSSRNDVVIHFLAALELHRRRQARVYQDETFGDISVELIEEGVDTRSRAG